MFAVQIHDGRRRPSDSPISASDKPWTSSALSTGGVLAHSGTVSESERCVWCSAGQRCRRGGATCCSTGVDVVGDVVSTAGGVAGNVRVGSGTQWGCKWYTYALMRWRHWQERVVQRERRPRLCNGEWFRFKLETHRSSKGERKRREAKTSHTWQVSRISPCDIRHDPSPRCPPKTLRRCEMRTYTPHRSLGGRRQYLLLKKIEK